MSETHRVRSARFRPPGGTVIASPAAYTAGASKMYCRNVYHRTRFFMPRKRWVVDLSANRGLFSVWAVLAGAQVVAVKAGVRAKAAVDPRDNAGASISTTSSRLGYAYLQWS